MSRLVITGAGGFLGRAIAHAAKKAGADVVALSRADVDLAEGTGLADYLSRADAVIHAAVGAGDEVAHARDTVRATETLIASMPAGARLVLVSSLSVYSFEGLPDWAQLDETSPTDPDGCMRDAYSRAKIAQEKRALHAAQMSDLDLWIARPGAVFGPGATTTARLGWCKGGRWLTPGGDVPIPAIHVEDCARALVKAAQVPDGGWPEDMPIVSGNGHVRIVNLVSSNPPSQTEWLRAMGAGEPIILPRNPLMQVAMMGDLAAALVPPLNRVMPVALRPQTLAARFKPLRYSTHRLQDRLAIIPAQSFTDAMVTSVEHSS